MARPQHLRRFVRTYVKPFWFRMGLVMCLAGVTSSYTFILGFISKMTVDHVLQIRADEGMVRKVFHVLDWTSIELERTLSTLHDEMALLEVQVEGIGQPLLVSTSALGRAQP